MLLQGSGRDKTVLLLTDRWGSAFKNHLANAGYRVLETYTPDQAVAVCVNNPIDAAVLDQNCFVETEGWSVAQSLKAVKAQICVLLAMRMGRFTEQLPEGVDALVAADDPSTILSVLARFLSESERSANRQTA